jgi:hypothetical protein
MPVFVHDFNVDWEKYLTFRRIWYLGYFGLCSQNRTKGQASRVAPGPPTYKAR